MDDKSEVARIKRQIEEEQFSMYQGLYGPTLGMSQHEFITKRMQRVGELHEALKGLVGEQEANEFLKGMLEGKSDGKE